VKPLRLRFHPAAVDEAEAALAWYAERSAQAASRFLAELERVFGEVSKAPEQWPQFEGPARRMLLRHFPYAVIYRVAGDAVEVLAVAHGRRRPAYWKKRGR
jgi:plasmid stabilization system protein ParE